jgi:hypothetical protein
MSAHDSLMESIADANPVAAGSELGPEGQAEALRVRARVLGAPPGEDPRRPGRLRTTVALAASLALVLGVAGLVLAGHDGRGGRPVPRSSSGGQAEPLTGSFDHHRTSLPWWHVPGSKRLVSVAPGRIVLARLRLGSHTNWFIYGQRIRFWGLSYFCLSAGTASGSFQTCRPWPLAHEPAEVLAGGAPFGDEIVLAVGPRGESCTFHGLIGGPHAALRTAIPAALKIDGDVDYAVIQAARYIRDRHRTQPRGASAIVLWSGAVRLPSCRR